MEKLWDPLVNNQKMLGRVCVLTSVIDDGWRSTKEFLKQSLQSFQLTSFIPISQWLLRVKSCHSLPLVLSSSFLLEESHHTPWISQQRTVKTPSQTFNRIPFLPLPILLLNPIPNLTISALSQSTTKSYYSTQNFRHLSTTP